MLRRRTRHLAAVMIILAVSSTSAVAVVIANQRCIFEQCGIASQWCIPPAAGGLNSCIFCDGATLGGFCAHKKNSACNWNGGVVGCGQKYKGGCGPVPPGVGPADGWCTGNLFQLSCSMSTCGN